MGALLIDVWERKKRERIMGNTFDGLSASVELGMRNVGFRWMIGFIKDSFLVLV